ncbi:hypothetical protein ATO13_18745 [Stappia sp. 22II-S9-Z10]|nr:hypothetical protein ATO13_18745 [Stappia sp. 22II-S9-Z10]
MDDVRIRLKAADLPAHLRGTIDPAHEVEVSVRDLGASETQQDRAARAGDIFRAWDATRQGPPRSTQEILQDVNALRDEWER